MGVKRNLDAAGFSEKITEDEAALYDRQIRLWGMDCQKRLREAKFFIIGLNGVGAEIVKNLTLSGVKSITILDNSEVKPSDSTAQFFVSGSTSSGKSVNRAEASVAAIRELNPNVAIYLSSGDPNSIPDKFFIEFNSVIATECPVDVLIKINKICRDNSVLFYCADTWGFYGYCFLDLQRHEFTRTTLDVKIGGTGESKVSTVKDVLNYCPLGPTLLTKCGEGLRKRVNKVFVLLHIVNHFREMFNRSPTPGNREKDITELKKLRAIVCEKLGYDTAKITDEMLSSVFGELSPVCAVVGGIVVNEVIKGISQNGRPICNYFLFDGHESVGVNETIIVT